MLIWKQVAVGLLTKSLSMFVVKSEEGSTFNLLILMVEFFLHNVLVLFSQMAT